MCIMTIDPGIAGTGWAIFDNDTLEYSGVLTPPKALDWQHKMNWLIISLKLIATKKLPGKKIKIYVEMPAMFGSAKGQVTASSGALVKLTLLVGQIMREFSAEVLPVNEWKGQLSKQIVEKRVKDFLPGCTAKSHAIDAIGMGLYLTGRF